LVKTSTPDMYTKQAIWDICPVNDIVFGMIN
jgi:hypothetical protein